MSVPREIISFALDEFKLDQTGIHGIGHWARVRVNGLRLAKLNGANATVVEHFAFLHDVGRWEDGDDPYHGPRAARYVEWLAAAGRIRLTSLELALLVTAIDGHTGGTEHHDVTVATCWDADRLDLTRVDVVPDPRYMCTDAGRELARKLYWDK